MKDNKIKLIVYSALFAALVFVATYIIKIPSVVTNGYVHIGDGFIFLAVILLGKKYGSAAGAIGAALCDMLAGYAHYILPTLIIKFVMGFIMGTVIEKKGDCMKNWILGSVLGSILQIIGYYVVGSLFMGSFVSTLMDIPGNTVQSFVGIVIMMLLAGQLKKIFKLEVKSNDSEEN